MDKLLCNIKKSCSAYRVDQADGALSSAAVPRPMASSLMPLR
jgi:hypothetical protein